MSLSERGPILISWLPTHFITYAQNFLVQGQGATILLLLREKTKLGINFTNFIPRKDIRGETSHCVTNSSIFDVCILIMINNAWQKVYQGRKNNLDSPPLNYLKYSRTPDMGH